MFNERVNKLLMKDNPIDKKDKKDEADNHDMEMLIVQTGANVEEVPDFFKMFEEKNLTESEKDDTIDDNDLMEIEALKKLIKKYKSEM